MDKLHLYIESLIFASAEPITIADIRSTLKDVLNVSYKEVQIEEHITSLTEKYQSDEFSMEIVAINDGYQFMSKGAYHEVISSLLRLLSNKRLSKAALETLSIIAYKQPVSKSEMEGIRGVNCDYTVQKLLEKELVEIVGRAEGPGRPLLYGTSNKFMNYFGIKSIKDLPKLKEVEGEKTEDSVGQEASVEEYTAVFNIENKEENNG
jgi:segregation and condensation protein B